MSPDEFDYGNRDLYDTSFIISTNDYTESTTTDETDND